MEEKKNSNIAGLIVGIIGLTIIFVSVFLGIIGSVGYMIGNDYEYETLRFFSGLLSLAGSFFWGGVGLNFFALILSIRKK